MTSTPTPILSEPIDLATLGDAPRTIGITASPDQCARLAASFHLPAIPNLSGRFKLSRRGTGPVSAQLDLSAIVTQTCVVSLDAFDQPINERTTLTLLTSTQAAAIDPHASIDPDAPDDIIADGTIIDLGAILAEQLALALDPYPRKSGVILTNAVTDAPASPFASLARIAGRTQTE